MSKPSSRKAAKRAGRAKAVRAKVTTRRAKLRELRDAVGRLDPSRNLHVEKGRVVTVNDITPHARPKCKDCKGKGITGTNKDDDGKAVSATPCRCATSRFFKAHPEVIVDARGASWWPLEQRAPQRTAAVDANSGPEPTT
jgi:hypothetical protein